MNELTRIIRLVRRRYRLRVFLRGALVVAAGAFALFVVSAYVLEHFRFEPAAVIATRVLFFAGLAALAFRYLVMPLTRRVSDEQVALYIEEHEPSLEAAIVSAVQHGGNPTAGSPALVRRLVEGAIARARTVEEGRRIERKPLRLLPAAIAGVAIVAIGAALGGPDFFRHALTAVFRPWSDAAAAAPYAIRVEPGNALVARGGDQRIAAALRNFDAEEVRIMVQRSDTSAWEALAMGADSAPGTYMAHLFDLEAPLLYYVEAAGVRSGTYRLDVRDLPYARQVDVEYRFPAYTGLPPQTVENGGDVAALRGTTVQLRVTPTIATSGGRIVIEGGEPVALIPDSGGTLSGRFQVAKEGFYRIELAADDGTLVPASLQYTIEVLPDRAPSIEIVRPGRDTRATSVEEVFIEARAEDDYGVARLELVYSVNGGPEKVVALHGGRPRKEVAAGHTLFLEEYSLEPGDIVSYHARAADGNPYGGPGRAATDIYFLQIRPFDREYRAAEQSGMPGEGEDTPEGLSEQQREIVAATFKSARDRAATPAAEFRENLATISLAQGRLRDRVEVLAQRLVQRGIAASDSTFAKIAAELPHAVAAMRAAEGELAKRNAQAALSPEQKALQHLLRAEAAFREVQVSRGEQQPGQGRGQQSNPEELADLFELENDRLENQYETVQRGREEAARQQVDEAMERLKQLASRQQQENERLRREAERMRQQSGGTGGSTSQRQLAAEADSLARQLERLAREQSSQELRQSARQLQQAADAMRRSAARSEQGGAAQGTNALQRLEEARRLLDRGAASRAEEQTRAAAERARRASEEQRAIAAEADRLQAGDATGRQRLEQRKDRLAGEVGELERELDRAARDTRRDHREAARKLQEATTELRDRRVREKIEYSKRLLGSGIDGSRTFEEGITANLDRVREAAEAASASIGEPEGRRAERAIERARELARGMESLAERAREGGQADERTGGQEGREGQDGRDGQDDPRAETQEGEGREGQPQTGVPNQMGGGQTRPSARIGEAPAGDNRQLGRELRQRRMDAERLRQELAQQGVDVRDLDRLIGEMRRLEGAGIGTDRRAAERLQTDIVQGLKDFEFSVRRALGGDDENRPRLGRQDGVPPEYRALVEKYYESLAR